MREEGTADEELVETEADDDEDDVEALEVELSEDGVVDVVEEETDEVTEVVEVDKELEEEVVEVVALVGWLVIKNRPPAAIITIMTTTIPIIAILLSAFLTLDLRDNIKVRVPALCLINFQFINDMLQKRR